MYIVAIAWGYVVLMMSITEDTVVAGIMTFVLYGILPLTIILYIMGTPQRKRNRVAAEQAIRATRVASAAPMPPPDAEATQSAGAASAVGNPSLPGAADRTAPPVIDR